MAAFAKSLNEIVAKLARKQTKALIAPLVGSNQRLRADMRGLKQRIEQLERAMKTMSKDRPAAAQVRTADGSSKAFRFRAQGVKAHRERLGLSAEEFGRLLSVSGQAIYNWEKGTSRPRQDVMQKFAAMRSLGKREAQRLLQAQRPITSSE